MKAMTLDAHTCAELASDNSEFKHITNDLC